MALALLVAGCSSGSVSSGGTPGDSYLGGATNGTGRGSCRESRDCDDGNYCNGTEVCSNGFCRSGTPVDCDDGIDCTRDTCDEAADRCQSTPNHALCGDGICRAATGCTDGVTCERPEDCDDGDFCNGRETCNADGLCEQGDPVDCDDGNDCTVDNCSERDHICTHLVIDADGDGHGDANCPGGTDCDDDDASINPGAREICNDLIDNDCDRDRDCSDDLCADTAACRDDEERDLDRNRGGRENCTDGRDNDGDRVVDCRDSDCDDDPACGRGRDGQGRRGDRDPCIENDWYGDGRCDDVCWRRDSDCDRGNDRNRDGRNRDDRNADRRNRDDRNADRNGNADRRRDANGVDQRRAGGACGRVTTAGRCQNDKTLELCTGEGRNERLVTRQCEGEQVCRVENNRAQCVGANRGRAPAGWTCSASYYGTRDGCDCNCGARDPDCDVQGQEVLGCDDGQTCGADGRCSGAAARQIPAAWQNGPCPNSYYGARDGCDCGCGAHDPDCDIDGQAVYGCDDGQVCGANDQCAAGRAGTPGGPPAGWNEAACPASYFADRNGCDCGCGARDTDCNLDPDTHEGRVLGCDDGQVCSQAGTCTWEGGNGGQSSVPAGWDTDRCPAHWYDAEDGCDCGCGAPDPDCDLDGWDGRFISHCPNNAGNSCNSAGACVSNGGAGGNVPAGWTCDDDYYDDGDCDCGCGVADIDCDGDGCSTAGCNDNACEYCWGGGHADGECDGGGNGGGGVPAGWTCDPDYYSDGDCDCGCGVADPTCNGGGCTTEGCYANACDYCDDGQACDEGGGGGGGVPAGWTCDADYYGDNECDCGCGAADVDCGYEGCSTPGCTDDVCEYCWGGGRDGQCDAGGGGGGGGGGVPAGWTCDPDYYSDGDCDCGCGVADPRCGAGGCTTEGCYAAACDYCDNGYTCDAPANDEPDGGAEDCPADFCEQDYNYCDNGLTCVDSWGATQTCWDDPDCYV